MIKTFKSPNYNYIFNYNTGLFMRWGAKIKDNPMFSHFGAEIMDIEVSTICSRACSWCYKSNTAKGKYMNFPTFKKLFDKFPELLTQIAFGVGDIDGNPDLWKIMSYCRKNKVVPNITINGERLTGEDISKLSSLCGAVAVSMYNKDICYSAVERLSKSIKQVNIHMLLCEETYDDCFKLIDDIGKDQRLSKMKSIVFLWLKPKGTRNQFHCITSLEKYKRLVDYALQRKARIGFDSCSANNFLKTIKGYDNYKTMETMVEPCESTLFSYYINVEGQGYPCSFMEEGEGINILKANNFLKDVWMNERTVEFRNRLLKNCRNCPKYDLSLKNG